MPMTNTNKPYFVLSADQLQPTKHSGSSVSAVTAAYATGTKGARRLNGGVRHIFQYIGTIGAEAPAPSGPARGLRWVKKAGF